MTVCDLCKGTGKLLKPWYSTTGAMTGMTGDICFMCDGKGTIGEPMTNEEWLRSCTTEQLAKWLQEHMDCSNCDCNKDLCYKGYDCCELAFLEWLKQPHTNE